MFTIGDYLKLISHKITHGGKFCWDCYGDNAHYYNYHQDDGIEVEIIFDTVTKTVYEASVFNDGEFKYFNPDYDGLYTAEAGERGVDDILEYTRMSLEEFLMLTDELINV